MSLRRRFFGLTAAGFAAAARSSADFDRTIFFSSSPLATPFSFAALGFFGVGTCSLSSLLDESEDDEELEESDDDDDSDEDDDEDDEDSEDDELTSEDEDDDVEDDDDSAGFPSPFVGGVNPFGRALPIPARGVIPWELSSLSFDAAAPDPGPLRGVVSSFTAALDPRPVRGVASALESLESLELLSDSLSDSLLLLESLLLDSLLLLASLLSLLASFAASGFSLPAFLSADFDNSAGTKVSRSGTSLLWLPSHSESSTASRSVFVEASLPLIASSFSRVARVFISFARRSRDRSPATSSGSDFAFAIDGISSVDLHCSQTNRKEALLHSQVYD